MKKTILSIAIALALTSSAFAKHPDAFKNNAVASFQKDFKSATEVSWSETSNYMRATFRLDKQTLFAYYDYQGNLVGLVHHLLTTSLPENLQSEIKKEFPGYWVSELFQVTFEDGSYYFIQLKNADETIVLKTDGNSNWHVHSISRNNP